MEPSSILAELMEFGAIFARVTELSASIFVVMSDPLAAPATPLTAAMSATMEITIAGDGIFIAAIVNRIAIRWAKKLFAQSRC